MKGWRLLILVCFSSFVSLAGNERPWLYFNHARFQAEAYYPGISPASEAYFSGKIFAIISFSQIPDQKTRDIIDTEGISLCTYLPDNSFFASIPATAYPGLGRFGVNGFTLQPFGAKTDIGVAAALNSGADSLQMETETFGISESELRNLAGKMGLQVLTYRDPGICRISGRASVLRQFIQLPFVTWAAFPPEAPQPLNLPGYSNHRSSFIGMPSGRNLRGSGVTIGVGDGGYTEHTDHRKNVVNTYTGVVSGFGSHGDHVTGIVGGGGIINPQYQGMAPASTVFTNATTGFVSSMNNWYNKYRMVLTNNSYGYGAGCGGFGTYTADSRFLDYESRIYPSMLHCFAAGNNGGTNCTPIPFGYKTILPGFQPSKNILVTGNVQYTDANSTSSSRGPTRDGRIKPDVSAVGQNVFSTVPTNTYAASTGTSMASPGAAGTMALLYQRHRQLNSGTDPDGALIKAIAMNTAEDLGNKGPDFIYGYGRINARRAAEAIENNRWYTASLSHGDSATHILNVPAGARMLKVLLYWKDAEGSSSSYYSLVNNLDLQVTNPSSVLYRPWVLDTTNAGMTSAATRGTDRLNNTEQVTVLSPASGNWTLKVKGTNIPSGPQKYYLSYEILNQSVTIVYPSGDEKLIPGSTYTVRWDTCGITSGTYTIDYSTDSGSSWNTISSVAYTTTYYDWTVPGSVSPTRKAFLRIRHSSASSVADTSMYPFTIMPAPVMLTPSGCNRQVQLKWRKISSAAGYKVYQLINYAWQQRAYVTDTSVTLNQLVPGLAYWFTVEAAASGNIISQKAVAVSHTALGSACSRSNDAGISALSSPLFGREYTSNALGSSVSVVVNISNFGSNSISNIPVRYRINGGSVASDTFTGTIASNATQSFTLKPKANLAATGSYRFELWTDLSSESERQNDTFRTVVKNLTNTSMVMPYSEGFENTPDTLITETFYGISGATRWDYSESTIWGRMHTALRPDIRETGSRCISLDKQALNSTVNRNYLLATLNLSGYKYSSNLLLNFSYLQTGEDRHSGDSVWIRGADTLPWIGIYDLYANRAAAGTWKKSGVLNVTSLLSSKSQSPGASFQLRFGQEDNGYTRTLNDSDGLHFDNISLVNSPQELQLLSVVSPNSGCGLTSSDSVRIRIKNNGLATISYIPVVYRINGGTPVLDTVKFSIPKDSVRQFTFRTPANLSTPGLYLFDIWCNATQDSFRNNDTVSAYPVRSIYSVSSFPYLEHFESSSGYFYSEGTNSSWAWGTPAKTNTRNAANGSKAWTTSLTGNYNNNELSFLYSPCFDLTSFSSDPILSFNLSYETETGFDFAWVEYSWDKVNWYILGSMGSGTGWYNNAAKYWEGTRNRWQVSSCPIPLSSISNKSAVQFRWVMYADGGVTGAGPSIDDIHIFSDVIQPVNSWTPVSTKKVTGTGWNHFDYNGRRILSLYDDNKNLDTVTVGVKLHSGTTRSYNGQFTLNRNWWVKPKNNVSGAYRLRLYFTQSELDNLDASDDSVYSFQDLGVTKYDGSNQDSSFGNNDLDPTKYSFIPRGSQILCVPFNNGHYLEFSVSSFSEFWINVGGTNRLTPLPVEWIRFEANRTEPGTAELHWTISSASPSLLFKLQTDEGNGFREIASQQQSIPISGLGDFRYSAKLKETDNPVLFRISAQDPSGNISWSPVRIIYPEGSVPVLKPNPNPGIAEINLSGRKDQWVRWELQSPDGQSVSSGESRSSGNTFRLQIPAAVPNGVYLLHLRHSGTDMQYKLVLLR